MQGSNPQPFQMVNQYSEGGQYEHRGADNLMDSHGAGLGGSFPPGFPGNDFQRADSHHHGGEAAGGQSEEIS
jgi:hypothetical protein